MPVADLQAMSRHFIAKGRNVTNKIAEGWS